MTSPSHADLSELIGLFYSDASRLGTFSPASSPLPADFSQLLDHHHHMTVTVEAFFGQLVNVEVLETHRRQDLYWRKIVLRGTLNQQALMFGIVRLNLGVLSAQVRAEIELQGKPLGRVLIEHDVLREVQLLKLWHVQIGHDLAAYLETDQLTTYGRTALIYCDGVPAVELLEIVTPLHTSLS